MNRQEDILYNQIEEIYGKITYFRLTQLIEAERLQKNNKFLKWGQMILSALSTGGVIGTLTSNQVLLLWLSAFCSTALLVLTSYFKDVDLSSEYKRHLDAANQLWLIQQRYLSLMTDYDTLSREQVVKVRDELQEDVAAIYDKAPLTNTKCYKLAQKMIQKGNVSYYTASDLSKIMPKDLDKG